MAYLNPTTLHALPVNHERRPPEPTPVLFCTGPSWTRRHPLTFEHPDDRFVYKDQGPPMYRLLGAHYNVFGARPRTDYHTSARSHHFEPRPSAVPSLRNGALTFPPGPPPAQVAMFDGLTTAPAKFLTKTKGDMDFKKEDTYQAWDKYRYLPGPPSEAQIYNLSS